MTILEFLEQPELKITYFTQYATTHAIVFKVNGILNCNTFELSFEPSDLMDARKRILRLYAI